MVLRLINGSVKSDCYYEDLELGEFSQELLDKIEKLERLQFNYDFQKNKYNYTEDELLDPANSNIDFCTNESACNKPVVTPDGNIYFCPGFIALHEPICSIDEYEEQDFQRRVFELYKKPLQMCISDDLNDVHRFCPVKHRCDKKMCHYLNKKITGDARFPFSNFCIIKEKRYSTKMSANEGDVLMVLLNSMAKINEAILSLGTANPNPVIKNRLIQISNELNNNLESIINQIQGDKNGVQEEVARKD
jgi:hypothetical protein